MPSLSARHAASLLEWVRQEALDPAYAHAHEKQSSRERRPGPGHAVTIVIPLAVLGVLLAMAAAQARRTAPDRANERAALAARIEEESARVDALHAAVERLRSDVGDARDARLQITAEGRDLAAELAGLELTAGAVPVTGPGLRIVVDDADPEGPPGANRVLDVDLQHLVNGLWAAGAEAVAINGHRLTATTAIRAAGEAIVVAFRPLGRPYTVEAVGDPRELEARFVDGPCGRWFRTLQDNYGFVFIVATDDALRLPAASDIALSHAVARAGEEGGSGS